jgi:hypothetical protein
MSYRGGAGAPKVKKVMTQAINLMFEFLKNVSTFVYRSCYLRSKKSLLAWCRFNHVLSCVERKSSNMAL